LQNFSSFEKSVRTQGFADAYAPKHPTRFPAGQTRQFPSCLRSTHASRSAVALHFLQLKLTKM